MAKMISPAELAGIVVALLTTPEKMGELEEAESFGRFFGDIAEVVANHCGGSVRDVAPPEDYGDAVTPYLVTIRPHESLPSLAKNVWASADPDGFEGVGDEAESDSTSLHIAYREARETVAAAVAGLSANIGGKSSVSVGHWERHANHPKERNYQFQLDDQRASNGQAYVSLTGTKGDDDCMDVTVEVNRFHANLLDKGIDYNSASPEHETPCVHVHFDADALAFSVFKQGDALLLRPETDVQISQEGIGVNVCWRFER